MRIISGRFKSRQLVTFKADHIRPTTDRVKESIFNILIGSIEGARVLDLFSGTGNLGIEAISRGAAYAECVESNRLSLKIIRENLEKLKILKKEMNIISMDVFKYLKSYRGEAFEVIFIDPPFTEKWAHKSLLAVESSLVAKLGTVVVIEASRHEHVENSYGAFHLLDRRDFGDKSALFYKRQG